MWPRRRKERREEDIPTVESILAESDIDEARKIRESATAELKVLEAQAPYVKSLANTLSERRKKNHFGEELRVTYSPRRS